MTHAVVLLAVLILLAVPAAAADPPRPLVVAHRGLLLHAPENTLANFRACLELRLGFEFDVRTTKDGHLVCVHDEDVTRTTDGTGKVADRTLAEVRRLDAGRWFDAAFAGEKVPTVDEVLALVGEYRRHDVLIAVDLKAAGVEAGVVRLAEKHKVLDRLLFIGTTIETAAVRDRLKAAAAAARTAVVANAADEFAAALGGANGDWVYFRYLPSEKEAAAVRAAGKRSFIAGTAVSGRVPANWRRAAAVGLDGVLTDYPLDLRAELRAKK
jgi:glycerophosphoryl diester phosphodiesterase